MSVLTALGLLLSGASVAVGSFSSPPAELYSPLVAEKIRTTALSPPNPMQYPQYTDRTVGDWLYFSPDTWTTGFFPATLYAIYDRAQSCHWGADNASEWLALGRQWSSAEVSLEKNNTLEHDVGFVSFPFMDELQVNPTNQTAITAINQFAADLAARFSPIVGCTRSWDTPNPVDFEVIIDNMMNLELFFVSAALTGNQTLVDMAVSHANKTMQHHVRPDGSSFHVVEYNATSGDVIASFTAQGYSDSSTWSRGQAWGIYGFANSRHKHPSIARSVAKRSAIVYMHTNITDYLETSRRMASYFLDHLPDDGVVPWDFNAPLTPPRPADSSAAMIAANGLILLAQQEASLTPSNATGYQYYIEAAIDLLRANTELAWQPSWQSLLANGTVNNPDHNNLTGIVYGDYYFVRAGNELLAMNITTCQPGPQTVNNGSSSSSSSSSTSSCLPLRILHAKVWWLLHLAIVVVVAVT
ncbi:d-4,5 unsaturated-glucuronyl hydrolase-like protein [Rhodofomes roseus]|uniref:D-4,5 unsaturated-glucuronyl hydrolase-like protein n=1 Tax=Rhodofomes roseus TaxID=34475 RepID=A0ABQ8KVA9_9APHY|nr:d-4,5 unsaturated-glucuronyl hydrolase-like protein [Rhodofomes roseus]KAH9842985.1 d-4,5 unsaturated-glucuronyl hydrolase-like protein [Rhodofomes roseus]